MDRRSRPRGARTACARRLVANNLISAAPALRILLVTPTSPWAETFGAQQRTVLLYEALRKLADVDVLMLSEGERDETIAPDRPEIVGSLSWREPRGMPYKYAINRFVSQWCDRHLDWRQYRLAVGRYFTTITKIAWPRHVRTIADCDDIVYRYVPRHDAPMWRALAAAGGNLRTWQTRASLGRYDHAFVSCQRDRNLFGARRTSLLPNIPVGVGSLHETPDDEQDRILIVGSLWYAPNRNDFHDGDAVLVGIDAADMTRKCVALAEDRQLQQRIAASAQEIARERYTAERFTAAVHAAAKPLLC